MRASSSSIRRAERGGALRVAGRAVAALEVVQLVEQRRRRRARSGAPPCRSSPSRTCGCAGAGTRASSPSSTTSVGYCSAAHPLLGHARADDLVVVEAHTARRERAGLRLADVVEQRGEPHDQLGRVLRTTAIVWASTSLWVWIGSCSSRIALSSGRNSSDSPVSHSIHSPAVGSVDEQQLRQLVADPLDARRSRDDGAARRSRRRSSGTGREPELRRRTAPRAACAAGRPRTTSRAPAACAARCAARSAAPSNGSTNAGSGQRERHRVHREVAPRQIGLDVVGVLHLGLAALGPVHVGAVRRDLEVSAGLARADRAEARALRATPGRPTPRTIRSTTSGRALGGDVDVAVLEVEVEERVAHGAADEVASWPSAASTLGELADGRAGVVVRLQPLRGRAPAPLSRAPRAGSPRLQRLAGSVRGDRRDGRSSDGDRG